MTFLICLPDSASPTLELDCEVLLWMTLWILPKHLLKKFGERSFSLERQRAKNALASDLDRALRQLSVDLYQRDFHFIKELIQNAEDNAYEDNVCPSLAFKLIKQDVAGVGAKATLLILNNERGLRPGDVTALCSVGNPTKVGKRIKDT
ncbi:unnamed protein product [Calypogeia fissa]